MAAGGAVGGAFGAPGTGAAAGHSLGASISKWLGSGDYEVSQNSLVNKVKSSAGIPVMHNTAQSVVVRHKEYLGQVVSSIDFTVQGYFPLNPGRDDTFPWLSRIARRFQEYAFKGVVFHYVPTSGSISSTQALGSVMMQTSYRTTDAAPASKIEMLNEYWATEAVPYEAFAHPIECDPKENPFNVHYVRSGNVPTGESLLSYDLGVMHVATSGQSTDGTVLGDLWVTYEVELKKPVLSSNVTQNAMSYTAVCVPGTSASIFNSVSAYDGTLPITLESGSNTISIPTGQYGLFYISVALTGAASMNGATTWTASPTLANCTIIPFYYGNPTVFGMSATGSTGVSYNYYHCAVEKLDAHTTATILIPTVTMSGTFTSTYIRVFRVDV
jgi:hypothetical protein